MLAALHKPIYEHRIEVLADLIVSHLQEGDRVLDIGSGFGGLAAKIQEKAEATGLEIDIKGLEKNVRGSELVETLSFDGYKIPTEDDSYDVTILADVVHHEEDYMRLLTEVARITKRNLIVKDHTPNGFLGQQRISLIDWAANNPYGIKCLYRYFSVKRWREIFLDVGFDVENEHQSIRLYQQPFNFFFGNRLQYLLVGKKKVAQSHDDLGV